LLAPTILVFAIINPLGWLIYSLGLVARGLKIALAFAPTIIAGCIIGLPYGPKGVAFAYSAVMILWLLPHIAWCVYGTVVSFRDILVTAGRLLAIGIVAGGVAFAVRLSIGHLMSAFPRLVLESAGVLIPFVGVLLFVSGQKALYLDVLRGFRKAPLVQGEDLAEA